MIGGVLMVIIGVLYLLFEDFILMDAVTGQETSKNYISRALVGVQVGLTLLAMIITRSTVLSLQAKQGLPRGNQIMGWVVLGTCDCVAMLGYSY
jgi:GPI ethanolamine phosphate transferase 1